MQKTGSQDYGQQIELQRSVWMRKPVLRALYQYWYSQVVAQLSALEPTIEIGSGSGNFKNFYPKCVSTDLRLYGPWIDRTLDAQALDLKAGEAGNLVVFDVLHHLQRPLEFLRKAAQTLKTGGRLVLCEPATAGWGRLIYSCCHHEPLDPTFDPFAVDGLVPEPDPTQSFANEAIPEIIFWRMRTRTLALLATLRLVCARKFGFIVYPMTGGFNYPSLLPKTGLQTLLKIEDFILRPFSRFTGLRMLVVLEKL